MNIVITLAGHSRRFVAAGYNKPKFLIELDGTPIIEHVLDMFSSTDTFHFVINEQQARDFPDLAGYFKNIRRNSNVNIIEPHELGPVHSAQQISSMMEGEPVIITYCDFYVEWDYPKFLEVASAYKCSVPAFRGLHPASFGETNYAYMKIDKDGHLIELREKQSFTSRRHEEPASAGLYYFESWETFCHYANLLNKLGFGNLEEGYVSLLTNLIVNDGHLVKVTDVEKFICFGTPEDIEHYEFWCKYFRSAFLARGKLVDTPKTTVNLIPMAGRGSRFKKNDVKTRKPFINVGKKPMLARACASLPQANDWIFVALEEDENKYPIKPMAENNLNGNVSVVTVSDVTTGQAVTCMSASDLLQADDQVLISSCDYEVIYDHVAWQKIIDDPDIDACIWCIRPRTLLYKDPKAFAYCVLDDCDDEVIKIVEKNTISDTPQNDPLAIGVFWFRKSSDFIEIVTKAIERKITVNDEYYVGTSMNLLIEDGKKIKVFFADQWISYGDPFELEVYNFWEDHFWKRQRGKLRQ